MLSLRKSINTNAHASIQKLNVSFPANGTQKIFDIDDDRRLRIFMDKRMGAEVPADSVGDEWKGYILRITGGNDKVRGIRTPSSLQKRASGTIKLTFLSQLQQGFPMKQGVMHPTRVRLLLRPGHTCFRPRRDGERRRKSVRGCIVVSFQLF